MKFLNLLKKLRLFSDHNQHKMACVIAKGNKIISLGFNQKKTHPKSIASYNMIHAEIAALLGIDFNKTKGCTAYVYRENWNGCGAMAKPCIGCETALRMAGIKRIVYSTNNNFEEMRIA